MDTQNSSTVDVPNLKLAKVGKDRERKRGAAGWAGARGAGSAFSGATGGAGAGGLLGGGMSLAKMLTILLVSGVVSAGAWKMGNMVASNSASNAKSGGPKVFADKDSGKYADTSGVIKGQNTIPNSLGYINNDGLTDEQRAAKKAAEDAAAAKAAADAQAKADADAKEKALADAKAASATPDAAAPAPAAAPEVAKKGLTSGRFGGMNSSLGGGGGGGGLSGGAGLSGGIGGHFGGADGLGKGGALSAFRSPSKAATTTASSAGRPHSNAKGFARQQLDMANGLSRSALASGKTEGASAGAASPFDNNPSQGTVISGPGLGSGTQTGAADGGSSGNQSAGGGGGSGPIGNEAACAQGMEPDINGVCNTQVAPPTGQNAAPYQSYIDAALVMIGLVVAISLIAMACNGTGYGVVAARALCIIIALLGAAIAAMGVIVATMTHGDFVIGGILSVVGGFIAYSGASSVPASTATGTFIITPAGVLIASAIGGLAAMSAKSSQAAMQ